MDTREEKISLVKRKLTLVNHSLRNAANQIKDGKVVTAAIIYDLTEQQATLQKELKHLETIPDPSEQATPEGAPSTPSSAQPGASPLPGAPGSSSSEEEEEPGIPQRLRVKRHYTVTAAVIERNKKNSQARRPGSEGNKRNWKGGRFAKDFIEGRIKPCLSTCPDYEDCELITEGMTKPGGICLDKSAVIKTYSAIMDAIKHKEYDDYNEVSGLMVAEIMHLCESMMDDIMRDGGVVLREKYDKDGNISSVEYVPHPNLMALPKIIADLGLTPRELNITPKAIKDDKNTEEANETLGKVLGRVGTMIKRSEDKKPEGRE